MATSRPHVRRQTSRQSLRGRQILKQGYLKKIPQSGIVAAVKKYKERWFVFGVIGLEPFLEYYDNEDSVFTTTPINRVSLMTCRMVAHNVMETKHDHLFTITTMERQLNLVAKDRVDRGKWCDIITTKLGELGILTNLRSHANVYEELPVQKNRIQRPLPPEPGTITDGDPPPPPTACNSFTLLSQHRYVNTSLPPPTAVERPPPLPPRPPSASGSGRTSTSEELVYFPSTTSTNSSDFEDPFEALASSRVVGKPDNSGNDGNVADLSDIVLENSGDSSAFFDGNVVTSGSLELSPSTRDKRVEITPNLSNLTGLADSDSESDEEYAPIWHQSSSSSAGQGAISGQTERSVQSEGRLSNSGHLHLASVQSRAQENDYGASLQRETAALTLSGASSKSSGSVPPRQLSFVSGSSQRSLTLPLSAQNAPTTTQHSAPTTTPQSAPSTRVDNSPESAFSRKCAEVDATNPFLTNTGLPPPYSAEGASPASQQSPFAPQSPNGAASPPPPPPEYTETLPSPSSSGVVLRRRQDRHSLANMQQLRSPMERCKSLKQSQVELLQTEIDNPGGVFVELKRRDCFQTLAVVDMLGAVWIAGWAYEQKPFLHNAFHIGDQVIGVGGHVIKTAQDVHKIIKHSPPQQRLTFNLRRVPHGRVLAIVRSVDGESLGIHRLAGTPEIISIIPNGLAAEFGLTPKTRTLDGNNLCNWVLTEVNMRPLNLFFKDNEIEHRLNAVGKDISIMVQPSDFINMLKKKLKTLKNYKDFLVM